jgi:hypothetical protein
MFIESRGKPIIYEGKTLIMGDDFPLEGATSFRLVFEACKGEWRQGVALNCKGSFLFRDQSFNGKAGIVFWQDTAPQFVELRVTGDPSSIQVKNVWDVGDGVIHSWHNGAAMIVESLSTGRRYRCNDGFADDDFDDIVFRLERVSERQQPRPAAGASAGKPTAGPSARK